METAPAGLGDDRDEEQVPTEAELAMLANLKERLAFLVKTDSMYDEIANLSYRKTAASIRVFYKKPNKGSLFSFHLTKTNSYSFKFHTTGKEFETTNLKEINEPLLQSFIQRLEEHGVSIEKAPILRSVS